MCELNTAFKQQKLRYKMKRLLINHLIDNVAKRSKWGGSLLNNLVLLEQADWYFVLGSTPQVL